MITKIDTKQLQKVGVRATEVLCQISLHLGRSPEIDGNPITLFMMDRGQGTLSGRQALDLASTLRDRRECCVSR